MASSRLCLVAYTLMIVASAMGTSGDSDGSKDRFKKQEDTENLLSTNVGVEGLVYCKSGSKLIPLEGAVTRITCKAVDEYGMETTPFTFLSGATDAKGYFLATLSGWEVIGKKVKNANECRGFLELSPSSLCSHPSDFNNAISGAFLRFHRFLPRHNLHLFTVGPFLFTP